MKGFHDWNYTIAFTTGICFWLLSILAIHQIKLSIDRHEPEVIHKTISVFFIINAIVSLSTLLIVIFKTGVINPYLYQGEYQKYFIGTGDYIRGISFDISTTNAILNAFGVIYFLHYKKPLMVLLCMGILLLTGSNITNIILCTALTFVFIFQSDKTQKSLVFICLFFLVVFMTKISPQNNQYLVNSLKHILSSTPDALTANASIPLTERHDNTLTREERKQKTAMLYLDSIHSLNRKKLTFVTSITATPVRNLVIPTDDINTPAFQHKSFITPVEENMFQFINMHSTSLPMSAGAESNNRYPGKILALQQTYKYMERHPLKIATGTGVGNFSSKLGFKISGINVAGTWPSKFTYINDAFLKNHLDVYLYYFSKTDGLHSAINNPASVYDQLISEYGIAGLAAYFIFYVWFFLRNLSFGSFGIPLLIILSGIFFFDYWFEQLSIVIFFELLLFLNLKEVKARL